MSSFAIVPILRPLNFHALFKELMGSEQSTSSRPLTTEGYVPVGEMRTYQEHMSGVHNRTILSQNETREVLKRPFTGTWSMRYPKSLAPVTRHGHFYCYDQPNHRAFMGYGNDAGESVLSDFWVLDTLTDTWKRIHTSGDKISARTGSRAVYHMGKVFVFGGYSDPNYLSDLHTIDPETGFVTLITTTGDAPAPRTTPLFAAYGSYLYVWGGYNGEWPSDLHILNLETLVWTRTPQDIIGRVVSPGVIFEGRYYTYAGSKSAPMLILDFETGKLISQQTKGAEPPSETVGGRMTLVDKFMIYFGGKANSNWTLVYACDLTKMWWFVFHIAPDEETVTLADGAVSDLGLFLLPRIHSFGVCYVPEKREIVAFMGSKTDPPPLFVLSIGDAMAVINLREDMLGML